MATWKSLRCKTCGRTFKEHGDNLCQRQRGITREFLDQQVARETSAGVPFWRPGMFVQLYRQVLAHQARLKHKRRGASAVEKKAVRPANVGPAKKAIRESPTRSTHKNRPRPKKRGI